MCCPVPKILTYMPTFSLEPRIVNDFIFIYEVVFSSLTLSPKPYRQLEREGRRESYIFWKLGTLLYSYLVAISLACQLAARPHQPPVPKISAQRQYNARAGRVCRRPPFFSFLFLFFFFWTQVQWLRHQPHDSKGHVITANFDSFRFIYQYLWVVFVAPWYQVYCPHREP